VGHEPGLDKGIIAGENQDPGAGVSLAQLGNGSNIFPIEPFIEGAGTNSKRSDYPVSKSYFHIGDLIFFSSLWVLVPNPSRIKR
jgi:hypothetical protein